jgi:Na+-transporting NADH:ubiquinone oxidoreductase subunit NqrE
MPLLRSVGAWLMTRGISPGEPGWHFVPVVAVVAAPLTVSLFAVAMAYELVRRLPFGNRLGVRDSWIIAVAIVAGLLTTVVAVSLVGGR